MSIRSFGFRLYIDGVAIAGIRETTPPSPEASIIDITDQDSTAREFMGGMIDGGTLTINGLYDFDDAGQAAIFDAIGTEAEFAAVYSDGSGVLFTGEIQSFGDANPLDDAVGFTCPIKVTGKAYEFPGIYYVTGTLTDGSDPVTFPALQFEALNDLRPKHMHDGAENVYWDNGQAYWYLTDNVASSWTSTANVPTPDLVPTGDWHETNNPHAWKPESPATGTPVIVTVEPS
jgi:hypothetical protein